MGILYKPNIINFKPSRLSKHLLLIFLISAISIFYIIIVFLNNWPNAEAYYLSQGINYEPILWAFFMLNDTHVGSLLTYYFLLMALWITTKKPIASIIITMGCIAWMEFSCIPQHWFFWGFILPYMLEWYAQFLYFILPFYAVIVKHRFSVKRQFWIFFIIATIGLTLAGWISKPGAFNYWDWPAKNFIYKPVLPNIDLWVYGYQFIQRFHKFLYALAFYFVRPKDA